MLVRFDIVLLSFVCLTFSIFGQEKKQEVFTENDIHRLLDKANLFYKKDFDSAIYYVDKALSKINSEKEVKLYANAILKKSTFLWFKPEYKSAFELIKFNLNNKEKLDSQTVGKTYFLIGNLFRKDNLLDSSLVNYTKALKAFGNDTINHRDISRVYLEIGLIYSSVNDEPFAQKFYDQSIAYSSKSGVMKSHKKFIESSSESNNHERELELDLEILEIAKRMNDDELRVRTYSSLASCYRKLGRYDKALEYQNKILASHKKANINTNTNGTLYYIAELYLLNNKPRLAIPFLKQAEQSSSDTLRLNILYNLKTAYLKIGNKNEAIAIMEHYIALKDSINNRNLKASIAEITSKYNDEQQKQEIKTLNFQNEAKAEKISKQRLTLFGSLAGSVLLLLLGLFMYRNYRAKQELNYSQLNFKLLQTQLNPHFMFNALNEIKLNLDSHKNEESSEYLTAYSKLMRLILEGSNQEFVTLEEDRILISKFLQLQQLVHNNNFEYEITIDDALDVHYTSLPPMLTQPFVENAVIHGVNQIENGKIMVNYKQLDNTVVIEIIDNGKGLSEKTNQSGKQLHKSLGTSIIEQRIKNYKKLYNYTINSKVVSNKKNGTTVTLVCPLQLKKIS